MALIMNKDSAILQGAFLQAEKLCLPSSLSSLPKADWSRVGRPILLALQEICGRNEPDSQPNLQALTWKKRIVCVVWLKLLSREAKEDVEKAWRENPFFSLQNSFPEVNHAVLLELVKSTAAAPIFARFLLHLPQDRIAMELGRLTEHVRSDPAGEEDVRFFLEVWWELWKVREELKSQTEETIEAMFANQFARLSSDSPHTAKRLKLDSAEMTASSVNTDILHVLFNALKDMMDMVASTDVCFQSLSVSLDALYTSFLITQEVVLPITEKLDILCKTIGCRGEIETLSAELIRDAQKDLSASLSPSRFQPSTMKLSEALKIITGLAQFWKDKGLLVVSDPSTPCFSAVRLQRSIQRVLTALDEAPEAAAETDALRDLLKSLDLPADENAPDIQAQVTTVIIAHRLQDYHSFAELFAGKASWAHSEFWVHCLDENQAAFRQHRTLLRLSSTLMSLLHAENSDISRCRKLMKTAADIFSALSLEDKNQTLAAMLGLSSKGFFKQPVPSAVTEGFQQELNMAFNCIIQGGGGASAAVSQGNLTTAVSLVARVAFQNPEAAIKSCCHSAVFNKGAFSLMAKILQQLPGLKAQLGGKNEGEPKDDKVNAASGRNLLCRCLQDTIRSKSMSASEKQQLLKFLGLLMTPDVMNEEKKESFLLPQEVVNTFVLPNLSAVGDDKIDTEFSLQLLHAALSVEAATSPHWVLSCSPFPLLFVLAQLYNQAYRCWEEPAERAVHLRSMDTKELLVSVLTTLGQLVGAEIEAAPTSWSRALFWLYNKTEELDWTVRFHLRPVWGEHFKNEVPSSLLEVCDLPEQDWSGLDLPEYGQGTGLLAWMECCSLSDSLRSTMLSCLSLDRHRPDHVSMFSKGLLVALTQSLPWCSVSQWERLLGVLRELITSARLSVPFSLEYVDFLPLLDLRQFSCELRLSVLLLRVLQLLCGSSCADWLSSDGWAHVCRLYAHAVRDMMNCVKAKLPLHSSSLECPKAPDSLELNPSVKPAKRDHNPVEHAEDSPQESEDAHMKDEPAAAPSQEVLFVLSQLFCHIQHIQVMMPGGQSEPLFLCSLEILSHYEAVMAAFPDSCSHAESDDARHFFTTITDNLSNQHMKAVLHQKITQLVSSAA
ncbi:gem-associated protein 4 [Poecilia latipinna]|uniref:Gem (nuclear organelle) associated protein 4 n=1 Tax=Poecilia latipinna TaxID=48699 RepID=A0A3B3TTS5_9TELE|nr:PREDICTED: gem-associated protein 4 [Poecilia latipinna]